MLGSGFATYQLTQHVDNLRDTHNWYVKVLVETGIVGLIIVLFMFQQMFALADAARAHAAIEGRDVFGKTLLIT